MWGGGHIFILNHTCCLDEHQSWPIDYYSESSTNDTESRCADVAEVWKPKEWNRRKCEVEIISLQDLGRGVTAGHWLLEHFIARAQCACAPIARSVYVRTYTRRMQGIVGLA